MISGNDNKIQESIVNINDVSSKNYIDDAINNIQIRNINIAEPITFDN